MRLEEVNFIDFTKFFLFAFGSDLLTMQEIIALLLLILFYSFSHLFSLTSQLPEVNCDYMLS